jgi:hypothetical protein
LECGTGREREGEWEEMMNGDDNSEKEGEISDSIDEWNDKERRAMPISFHN